MAKEEMDPMINNIPRLQWACRRGMLELDVLLGNFLREAYPDLALADKKQFILLLNYSDPELFDWLLGYAEPIDPRLLPIIGIIRNHARSRV